MARVLMMSTISPTIEQFNVNNINILQSLGYEVHIATDFTDESIWPIEKTERFKAKMEEQGVKCFQIDFSRSMFKIGKHIKAYKQLKKLIIENEYAFIHTHTPIASVIGRLAAHRLGIKVIYTAHGFHFYTGAPLKNWLIFYPIEWICSWWTDVLITINKEDYKRASERLHAKKTVYVPGVGIDTAKFAPPPNGRDRIRKELGLTDDQIMLLSVGELNKNKNHEAVIRALQGMQASNQSPAQPLIGMITYVIVGSGELEERLKTVAKETGVDVRLTGYRTDVADFYDAADVYILPSIREGLNVSLMEAMASGLPCCVGRIRGNTDLIDEDACLFDPENAGEDTEDNAESLKKAIDYCVKHKTELSQKNLAKIRCFDFKSVSGLVDEIYSIVPPPQNLEHESIYQFIHSEKQTEQYSKYRHLADVIAWQDKRLEIGIPWPAKLLISVGELSKRKNHRIVVQALQILPDSYWYVIVGQGELKEELTLLDKTGRLKLLGYRTDIPDLLRASDLFVFPSLQEGLPVALMEAMSCGVACIASKIRGNVGLMGENALFEVTDAERLWTMIETEHKHTVLPTDFDKHTVIGTMEELYKRC